MNKISCLSLFIIVLASCATQVAPTGGEKDTKPPVILKYLPANYSTHFDKQEIEFSFDEYVQLKDMSSQLVVSPPLKYPVKATLRKKSLVIHIADTLQPNTTYTMNFGNAIADNHEGNMMDNFQYVFSTGDIIDSLTLSGKIENAFDKKTEKGIYIMLYRKNDDSLPLKMLPDYFAKTSDSGEFHVKNVSPGDYKIFALKDNNSNYLFDNNDELIAFSDSLVTAGTSGITLQMFKETPKQQLLKSFCEEPGKAIIAYSRPLKSESIIFPPDTSLLKIYSTLFSTKRDTVTIWYRNQLSDSLNLIIKSETTNDTLSIRLVKSDSKGKFRVVPSLVPQYPSKTDINLDPGKIIELIFNHPVEQFDLKSISMYEDSIKINNLNLSFSDSLKRILKIDYKLKEKSKYTVDIPAGTLTDIFGIKNDTLLLNFKSNPLDVYGTIALKIKLATGSKQYLVQLIDDKETVYRQSIIATDATLNYEHLDPKAYRLKMIEDSNGNNEWDTGNYLNHQQPERILYYKETITVRANWDVDITWNLK